MNYFFPNYDVLANLNISGQGIFNLPKTLVMYLVFPCDLLLCLLFR